MTLPDHPAGDGHPPADGQARDGRSLHVAAFLLVYALPLGVCVLGLALVGLGQLALALLVVEATVLALVIAVRRRPPAARTGPSRRPWAVPLALVGVLAALLALTVVVAAAGRP